MANNYPLQYRTLETLMSDVKGDFKKYDQENLIDEQDMIKVVRLVSYNLGLRIHETREVLIDIENGMGRLPVDFYVHNFGLVVGNYKTRQYLPQGTHVEERVVGTVAPEYQSVPSEEIDFCDPEQVLAPTPVVDPCDPCAQCGQPTGCVPCTTCCTNPESCTLNCNDEAIQLVQVLTSQIREWSLKAPLKILQATEDLNGFCEGLHWESSLSAEIIKGWIRTSFQTGTVYLNYQGHLRNAQGELLVPDHPMLNEYYEYAMKKRIVENLIMNDIEVTERKEQMIEREFRIARANAISVASMPNFGEMQEMYRAARKAFYSKYYAMFQSFPHNMG